jgi:hypothetical protein
MVTSRGRRVGTAALGAIVLSGALLVAAPASQAAGEAFTVTVLVAGDTQVQFDVCFTQGTSLPARITGTYTVSGGGATHSGNWWSTDPDLILVGTEACPGSIASVAVEGLQMSSTYTISASITADPVVEDDEGNFVADGSRSAVSLSSSTTATTTNGSAAPGPDTPCEEDCEPTPGGGASDGGGSGTTGGGAAGGGSGTAGSGSTGVGSSGGANGGGTSATVIPLPQVLRPSQMDALTPAEVGGIRPAAFARIPVATFTAISPLQAERITPAQAAVIGPERARAMTPSAVASLAPAAVAELPPASVARLSIRQVAALTAAQLRALTPRQIAALTPQQLAALTPAERALLRRR